MLRKFVLLLNVFVVSNLSGAFNFEENKWHEAAIRFVVNKSIGSIELSDQIKKELVTKGTAEPKRKFIIPFASMTAYMKEIHSDKPYIPATAIRVKTSLGIFGIWEDERGIQMCKVENSLLSDAACECLIPGIRLGYKALLKLQIDESGIPSLNQ